MKRIALIFLALLSTSCSALAEIDMRDFYAENSKPLNAILIENSEKPPSLVGGKEIWFPLFMKTKITLDIISMVHTPEGLLIKSTKSKVSFIRETSDDIFFVREGGSLLETYSDVFTRNMNELEKKYAPHKTEKQGIFDFKIALSILNYEETGYYQIDEFLIYYLLGKSSSEAFILNKEKPNRAMRVGYLGEGHDEFKGLLVNISNFN